jgi:hypothetical protein
MDITLTCRISEEAQPALKMTLILDAPDNFASQALVARKNILWSLLITDLTVTRGFVTGLTVIVDSVPSFPDMNASTVVSTKNFI